MARRLAPFLTTLSTLLVASGVAVLALIPPAPILTLQERGFDTLMAPNPQGAAGALVHVVEIDRKGRDGGPWTRADLAALLDRVAQSAPRVIGLDMVLTGDCGPMPSPSPATEALRQSLSSVAQKTPIILGFLLDDQTRQASPPLPNTPQLAVMSDAPAWRAQGAEMPCPMFLPSGAEPSMIALAGDAEGRIRSSPAAVFVAGRPFAAFAVAVARRALDVPPPVLGRDASQPLGGWLRLGPHTLALNGDGAFRLAPTDPGLRSLRRHRALDLFTSDSPSLPPGGIVLIGSTLPEAGGLRPSRITPLHPSLHLQADAVEQILTDSLPKRPPLARYAEALAALLAGIAGLMLARALPPVMASLAALSFALVALAAAALAARLSGLLIDPILPTLAVVLTTGLGVLAAAMDSRRTARTLGARMRRHLPSSVVSDLSRGEAGAAITAQRREITALFTDIEGFSAMTARLPPEDLVALLDRYMTLVTGVVESHGGIVDKIVGDSVHALFNAPDPLPDHVRRAISCATAIANETEALRQDPAMQAAGFGRTRIGLEAGMAVLGDIGRGGRVDYTAHGNAVNLAARLQEANKTLGTQVLIGPDAALRAPDAVTQGPEIELRSFGRLRVSIPARHPTQGSEGNS